MATVYELPISTGSLRDKYGNFIMTNNGSTPIVVSEIGKVIRCNGTDQYLSHTIANFRSADSKGAIFVRFKHINTGSSQAFFSSADTAGDTRYLIFYISSADKLRVIQKNNDFDTLIEGNSSAATGWNEAVLVSTGTEYKMYLNGVDEGTLNILSGANNGDWFADTISRDIISIGAWVKNTTALYMKGMIGDIKIINHVPTQAEIDQSYNEFLHSYNIEPPIRGFLNKVEHNVNEVGLLLLHNYENGNAIDLSSNGNDGTNVGCVIENGGFRKTIDTQYVSLASTALNSSTVWSVSAMVNITGYDAYAFLFGGAGNRNLSIDVGGNHKFGYRDENNSYTAWNGTANTVDTDSTSLIGNDAFIEWTSNGTNIYLYINGVDYGYITPINTKLYVNKLLRAYTDEQFTVFGLYKFIKIYNSTRTLTNHRTDWNKITNKVYLYETFAANGADGVDKLPLHWQAETGIYKIVEDANGKYMECASDGVIGTQQTQAYGTFEFTILKKSGNTINFVFINQNTIASSIKGYYLNFNTSEKLQFIKTNGTGTFNILFKTYVNAIDNDKYYTIRFTRTLSGIFTAYIKGGAYTNWTVMTVAEGSNPVTDNTYTTSNILSASLDTGDRVRDILVKRT